MLILLMSLDSFYIQGKTIPRTKTSLRQRNALSHKEELQIWSHIWHMLWNPSSGKLYLSKIMYMATHQHLTAWISETKAK